MRRTSPGLLNPLLLLLFTLSGFSGLIYESVWSRYLALILGHAAGAQTLVLSIFMGGMAYGAWFAGRRSSSLNNPLMVYALIETAIGLLAFAFHPLFIQARELLHSSMLPGAGNPAFAALLKWTVASALILPQSVLLGMTFPLMSAGVIRLRPEKAGSSLGMLYFTNSIGAAAGALVSAFVLMSWIGLPGAMKTSGAVSLLVAFAVWMLALGRSERPLNETGSCGTGGASGKENDIKALVPRTTASNGKSPVRTARLLLLAALLTGTASFFYEIGWIRMLSMVLGSTTQAFEIMLSAFITGLAFGGLWIRGRIDTLKSPVNAAGHVQILMGLLAVLTIPLYSTTFDMMAFLIRSLTKTDGGYTLFILSSHGIALAVMLPATFMAGMTLPLFTHALMRHGGGEASIGRTYAANTFGAILGVWLATHVVMPLVGVRWLILFGGLIDVVLGFYLLGLSLERSRKGKLLTWIAAAGIAALTIAVAFCVRFDPLKTASGVYRNGLVALEEGTEAIYHKDGKTATIDIIRNPSHGFSLITNGKPDASIHPSTPSSDEFTQAFLGVLPLAMHPEAKTIANIGMGSGMTTHTLLGADFVERVDTIEIEPAVVEGARCFEALVERAYSDPRSHIHIADAKTLLSSSDTCYDIIISEPSNPWVSGVAGLFTQEFYQYIKGRLNRNGLYVQWVQLYEFDIKLLASIFKAMSPHFSDYTVFNTCDLNIIIAAANSRKLDSLDSRIFDQPLLVKEMTRQGITHLQDIEVRRIGDKSTMQPLWSSMEVPANSDYFPYLSFHAPKSLYLKQSAAALSKMSSCPVPVLEMIKGALKQDTVPCTVHLLFMYSQSETLARKAMSIMLSAKGSAQAGSDDVVPSWIHVLDLELNGSGGQAPNDTVVRESLFEAACAINPFLGIREITPMWESLARRPGIQKLSLETKRWFTLHYAVARRDAGPMAKLSSAILGSGEGPSNERERNYLLTAGLAGYLSIGDKKNARLFWLRHSGPNPDMSSYPLPIRLLVSHLR